MSEALPQLRLSLRAWRSGTPTARASVDVGILGVDAHPCGAGIGGGTELTGGPGGAGCAASVTRLALVLTGGALVEVLGRPAAGPGDAWTVLVPVCVVSPFAAARAGDSLPLRCVFDARLLRVARTGAWSVVRIVVSQPWAREVLGFDDLTIHGGAASAPPQQPAKPSVPTRPADASAGHLLDRFLRRLPVPPDAPAPASGSIFYAQGRDRAPLPLHRRTTATAPAGAAASDGARDDDDNDDDNYGGGDDDEDTDIMDADEVEACRSAVFGGGDDAPAAASTARGRRVFSSPVGTATAGAAGTAVSTSSSAPAAAAALPDVFEGLVFCFCDPSYDARRRRDLFRLVVAGGGEQVGRPGAAAATHIVTDAGWDPAAFPAALEENPALCFVHSVWIERCFAAGARLPLGDFEVLPA